MNFLLGLSVFGMVCGCCLAAPSSVDCRNQTSMLRAMENCFSQFGISQSFDVNQIQNAIQNNMELVCSNSDAYKSGISCAMMLARTCLDSAGQSTDILPPQDRVSAGIDYLCDHLQDVDTECLQQSSPAMTQCGETRVMAAISNLQNATTAQIICKSYEIAEECAESSLGSCSGQTANVFLYYARNYAIPPVCQTGGAAGIAVTSSSLSLLVIAVIVASALSSQRFS